MEVPGRVDIEGVGCGRGSVGVVGGRVIAARPRAQSGKVVVPESKVGGSFENTLGVR